MITDKILNRFKKAVKRVVSQLFFVFLSCVVWFVNVHCLASMYCRGKTLFVPFKNRVKVHLFISLHCDYTIIIVTVVMKVSHLLISVNCRINNYYV